MYEHYYLMGLVTAQGEKFLFSLSKQPVEILKHRISTTSMMQTANQSPSKVPEKYLYVNHELHFLFA